MDFVNQTPLPAQLKAGAPHGLDRNVRLALLVAKATFVVEANGIARLDAESPLPCLPADEETELGRIPQDDLVRSDDDVFEVALLGAAHAPGGRPVSEVTVSMSLGSIRRQLVVIGDREWPAGPAQVEPFARLPMTWSRAFGGRCEVEIDRGAFVELGEPLNREGVGFDPAPSARHLKNQLGCPEGYPVVPPALRLPNLERPEARIRERSDAPLPTCWAPLSLQSGLHAERFAAEHARRGLEPEDVGDNPVVFHRAHPDWVIPMPARGAAFRLDNATPDGRLEFALPGLRVIADVLRGDAVQTVELAPQRLVVFAEERRFTLSYGKTFRYAAVAESERSLRLRLQEGWYA